MNGGGDDGRSHPAIYHYSITRSLYCNLAGRNLWSRLSDASPSRMITTHRQGGLTRVEAYERMQRIRRFEECCQRLTVGPDPAIVGSIHLCAGQEAIPVGAVSALDERDRVLATYRGHGWAIECGVPLPTRSPTPSARSCESRTTGNS
jgi:TPP-dependent pyruvate/acetoin dehydrogenase alpha subunit